MEASEWKIITCPHCASLVKVAGHLLSSNLACPSCKSPISNPSIPARPAEPIPKPAIPINRAFDPTPVRLRGSDREAWESRAPELREIDFKDRLSKTTDYAGSQELVTPVRRRRSFAKQESGSEWEGGHRSRRRHGGRWRMTRRFLSRFGWLIGLIILALTGIIYRYHDLNADIYHSNYVQTPAPDPVTKEEKERNLELQPTLQILQDIRPTLEKWLGAKSPADLRPLVRDPARVIPLMDPYYAEQRPFSPMEILRMPDATELFPHKQFVVVSLERRDFSKFYLTLEKGATGYQVDWESYVGYGEMPLSIFRMKKPGTPVLLRFDLRAVGYYNLDFEGREDAYESFQLSPADGSAPLYGYVARHSPTHEKIKAALLRIPNTPCVLKIRYPEHSTQDNQVEITEFVQKGYVIRGEDLPPPSPADPSHGSGVVPKSGSPLSIDPPGR